MLRMHWQDALLDANLRGDLSDSALVMGMKMARHIQWTSDRGPGLYWSAEAVVEAMGVTKSAFYRARTALIKAGLLHVKAGNLLPLRVIRETGSPTIGTSRPTSGTHMSNDNDSGSGLNWLRLTAETGYEEIAAAYPGHETDDRQYSRVLAATTAVAIYQRWPQQRRIDTSVLEGIFSSALAEHPRSVVGCMVRAWLDEHSESENLSNPVGLFYKQSPDLLRWASTLDLAEAR